MTRSEECGIVSAIDIIHLTATADLFEQWCKLQVKDL